MTYTFTIELPEEAFSFLARDHDGFAREMRLAASVKWYELGMVSQGRAAEIAGISREEFLDELARFKVNPFQVDEIQLAAKK
jgi:predicted HTH domain antitoxin